MAMVRLSLLLLLTAYLSFSAASMIVLMDSSNCVHLRCEWRGVGKRCKPATSFRQSNQQKTVPDATPMDHPFNESEASILARIQAKYPVNTFTLVNDDVLSAKCKRRQLWCNGNWLILTDDVTLKRPSSVFSTRPRLRC